MSPVLSDRNLEKSASQSMNPQETILLSGQYTVFSCCGYMWDWCIMFLHAGAPELTGKK